MSPAAVLLPSRREYWDQRLDGAGDIGLATDWRRDPMYARCVADERITVRLDPYLTGAGIDAFATMLAAWYAVLHRHTNQADLLVGTRYRHCPGESEVTSVVPLRTVFDPAGPFEALVAGSRETVAAAFLHSDTATGPYITELLAAHGLSMRVGFAVLREGPHYREGQEQIPEFDIELIAEDVDGQTTIHLSYDASLYSRPTAVRLLSHFTTALSEGIRAPQSPVRRLRVESEPASPPAWPLAAPEGWIPAAITQESLVDRFRSVVAAHSDRVAVSGVSGEYRYAELDRVSTAMAGRLDQLPGLGLPVALLCDHDIGLAVGIWSILKTGRGYVPLDPRQPDSRLARTIADAQVAALLCDVALAERAALLAGGRPVVTLDTGVPAAGDGSLAAVPADSVAYLLHTSGTTGGPKAVMQSHANVLAHSLTYANRTRIVPADRIPLLARFTFDLAVMDFFGALLTGASIQIIDPIRPASELWDKLAEARASILHCTPTLYRHLLAGAAEGRESRPCRVAVPDTFRLVVLGGEKVTRDDLQAFFRHFPGRCAMVSGLSATECSVALQHQARHADLLASSVPVGHAVEGIQVRLVDEDGWPTEVFGELEILSDRVALGYWNMPSATAAVFGEHPGRTRFYRTGDLARRLPDGALVHCGRKDRQVKIRGHRVEPGEIESLLRVHPSVAQAAVLLDQCASRPQLLAYVTSTTSVPVSTGELVEHLRRQLPDYMVPSRVRWLDVMPVGPTGKLDYSRLPLPEDEIASVADVPRSGLERAVATIWCQVLGLAEIGVRANFMAAGGDSIQLKTMLARLKEEFEADISLIDFLRSPTVGATAELIQRNGRPGVILAPARYLES